jgi:dynactin 1
MSEFSIGQVVQLNDGRFATVRCTEEVEFAEGQWIGVELQDASGKNDGSVRGKRYFECEPNYGMFVKPAAISVIEQPPPPPKPAAAPPKKAARPSSVITTNGGRRLSTVPDVGAPKRMSLNSGSPSPATRSRPSSMLRVSLAKFFHYGFTFEHFLLQVHF